MANLSEASSRTVKPAGDREGKYLTFTLADEAYGIGILKIREIIGMMPVTKIPKTPEFVKGIINLRGQVIPVMDLRLRFGLPTVDHTERTCIIVVEMAGSSDTVLTGIIVDAVSEVLAIQSKDIENPPSLGATLNMDFILGMSKSDGGVKILLNIDRVLSHEEISALPKAA